MPDSSLVEAALAQPAGARELSALKTFTGRAARRHLNLWSSAIERARLLAESDLPPQHLPAEGPPPARVWAEKDPAAAARLARARTAVQGVAEQHHLPVENLIAPDVVRRLTWSPPDPADQGAVRDVLVRHGARAWQVELTLDVLLAALGEPADDPPNEPPDLAAAE